MAGKNTELYLFVAENGSDGSDGSENAPFASTGKVLEAALEAAKSGVKHAIITVSGRIAPAGDSAESAVVIDNPVLPRITLQGSGVIDASGKRRVLYIGKKNSVTLAGKLTLTGGNADDSQGGGVLSDGEFIMEGGAVTRCSASGGFGGGVCASVFTMRGGAIKKNTARFGCGLCLGGGKSLIEGGSISGNEGRRGGGVYLRDDEGTELVMKGGIIFLNEVSDDGGGVEVSPGAIFVMEGGSIIRNSAVSQGGDVDLAGGGNFTHKGGAIRGNSLQSRGGEGRDIYGEYESLIPTKDEEDGDEIREALEQVESDGLELDDVPEEYRTEKVCLAAVQQNGVALNYVPENLRTLEMCFTAVTSNIFGADRWEALDAVPMELRTEELCMAAVSNYPHAIEAVPEDVCTEEIYIAAVEQGKNEGTQFLADGPTSKITKAVLMAAIENSDMNDSDICESILGCVPEELWKDRKILEALWRYDGTVEYIPKELWNDPDFAANAVHAAGGDAIRNAGESARAALGADAYLAAIDRDMFLLGESSTGEYVPDELWKDKAFCRAVLEKDGNELRNIPENLRTLELCLLAVKQNEAALEYVSEALKAEVKKAAGKK
ncbi:MAG: DUF4116 domain-containing protein [Treponema sp.]|jgi:hypothetical protein|nr:DUF4116 domain-containing protein [Treponema sp.]